MTDYRANLSGALQTIRQLGPIITEVVVSQAVYAELHRQTAERFASYGTVDVFPLGPRVVIDPKLPPGAWRAHYSDGRVRRYWPVRMDRRLIQVSLGGVGESAPPGQESKAHELGLLVLTKGVGWRRTDDPASAWEGQRVTPWSLLTSDIRQAVARMAESGGFRLTDWQRYYLTHAMASPAPITLRRPRFYRGL